LNDTRSLASLYILLAAVAFSTSGPLARLTAGIEPVIVACARTTIAGALLIGAGARTSRAEWAALPWRHRGRVALAGVVLGLHFAFFIAGMGHTSLAAGVGLLSLEPLGVIVAFAVAFRVFPRRIELVGLALATAGAAIVASGAGEGEHHVDGDLMVFAAVVLYGIYVAFARGVKDALGARTYIGAVYMFSGLSLLGPSLWFARNASTPPSSAIYAALALAFIPTLLGHSLVQLAARTARPSLVALVSPGETVGSLAIGACLMRLVPSARELVGTSVVILGVLVTMVPARSTR
jgi:drug/metabolite transporter (DMT)-like permease